MSQEFSIVEFTLNRGEFDLTVRASSAGIIEGRREEFANYLEEMAQRVRDNRWPFSPLDPPIKENGPVARLRSKLQHLREKGFDNDTGNGIVYAWLETALDVIEKLYVRLDERNVTVKRLEMEAVTPRSEAFANFGERVFDGFWNDGEPCDLDGGYVQEEAIQAGLLKPVPSEVFRIDPQDDEEQLFAPVFERKECPKC